MKLLGDFFTIQQQTQTDSSWNFEVKLNPEHFIFLGHFPGFPVTPAAIQLQMVHELLEFTLMTPLQFCSSSRSKFLRVINPIEDPVFEWVLQISKKEDLIYVTAKAKNQIQTFTQLQCSYQKKKEN